MDDSTSKYELPIPITGNESTRLVRDLICVFFLIVVLTAGLGGCSPIFTESHQSKEDVMKFSTEEFGGLEGSIASDRKELTGIDWETYVDAEYGFSIDYPSNWYHYRSSKGQSLTEELFVIFSSALGNTSTQDYTFDEEARLVVSVVRNSGWASAEEWLTDSPLLSFGTDSVTIAGLDGIRILVPNENQPEYRWISFVFLVGEEWGFSLVGSVSHTPNLELWKGAIQAMQDSFVLEE